MEKYCKSCGRVFNDLNLKYVHSVVVNYLQDMAASQYHANYAMKYSKEMDTGAESAVPTTKCASKNSTNNASGQEDSKIHIAAHEDYLHIFYNMLEFGREP